MIYVQHSRPVNRDAEVFRVHCDVHDVTVERNIPRLEILRRSSLEAEEYVRGEAQTLVRELGEAGCDCDKDTLMDWNAVILR